MNILETYFTINSLMEKLDDEWRLSIIEMLIEEYAKQHDEDVREVHKMLSSACDDVYELLGKY